MKDITAMTTRALQTPTDVYGPVTQRCTSRLSVANAHGLHARPAALLVKTALAFDTEIMMEYEGRSANAKSILGIMTLGAKEGAVITMTATGHDAAAALCAIENAHIFFNRTRMSDTGVECHGALGQFASAGRSRTAVDFLAVPLRP